MFDNYIYGNQNAVWLYMGQTPVQIANLDDLRSKIGFLKDRFSYVQELPVKWTRNLDTYLLGVGALMAEDLSKKSVQEIWDYLLRVAELGTNYFRPNIAISITQALLYKMFLYFITLAVGEAEAKRLFPLLIATTETKTNLVNTELYGLAQLAKKDKALLTLLSKTPSRDIIQKQSLKKFPAFDKVFSNFLSMHGHRETDFDYYIPTWVEAPWVVLDNLKLIITTPQTKTPLEKEYEIKIANQEAQAQLFGKLPQDLHFFYYEMLRLVRAYTSLDDIEHYQTTRLTLPIRKGTLAMGKLLEKSRKEPHACQSNRRQNPFGQRPSGENCRIGRSFKRL
jgi:pyruvate,water dikinase